MKNRIELSVEARETGKHTSRALRVKRNVPAVIYGLNFNANVFVHENEILKYNTRNYENALFNLKSSDKSANGKVVLMKSVDIHPVTRKPVHVDFFALDLTKPVKLFIEIRTEGKPIGLSEGGLLNIVTRSLEVECLPTEIPDSITVDVSELGIGMSVHVSDLKTPAGLKIISNPELTVAVVNMAEEEVIAAPVAAAAEAAPAAGAKGAAAPAAAAGGKAAPAAPAAKK